MRLPAKPKTASQQKKYEEWLQRWLAYHRGTSEETKRLRPWRSKITAGLASIACEEAFEEARRIVWQERHENLDAGAR